MRASQVDADGRTAVGAGMAPVFEQPATAEATHPAAITPINALLFTLSRTTGI
jgi:hypothetical protein